MPIIDKEVSYGVAMKDFFGYLPGTGFKEFSDELKALTEQDRKEFRAMLEEIGYKLKPL